MKNILFIFLLMQITAHAAISESAESLRTRRDDLQNRGLWNESLQVYKESLIAISDERSGTDLECAINSLERLHIWQEFDPLVESAIRRHPSHPAVLLAAAASYRRAPHSGRLVGGEFERRAGAYPSDVRTRGFDPGTGLRPDAGAFVFTEYRDRIRSLQLLQQALPHSRDPSIESRIWREIADLLMSLEPWKLQILSPIEELPEWGDLGPDGGTEGAPWAIDRPVLYEVPESWAKAANDGERWRYALAEHSRIQPASAGEEILCLARFSESQFSVTTMASLGWHPGLDTEFSAEILRVETLADDECLAQTSSGIRRFKLPASQHFIALYQSIADQNPSAGDSLTQIFLNRRQYHKARRTLERTIEKHGPGGGGHRERLLDQIIGDWGRFQPTETVARGTDLNLPLVFRNATQISLIAEPVDVDALLADTISYLKSNPQEIDPMKINPSDIAGRILENEHSKYLGKPAVRWSEKLVPRDHHQDTHINIHAPIKSSGAWWITGEMASGNRCHTLVWIVDSILVQHSVNGDIQWWLADARTGAPIENAKIDFFGYRTEPIRRNHPLERNFNLVTQEFGRETDSDGKTLCRPGEMDSRFRWLAIARKAGMSPSYHGFQHLSIQRPYAENPIRRNKSHGISDRPLYKAGDTVHLKFQLRNVGYAEADESLWSRQTGHLSVRDGRGEEVVKIEHLTTDESGAVTTDFVIPEQASLGSWTAILAMPQGHSARVSFRVEEYRKPEYEVIIDAPTAPVQLGETFDALIRATYFHGAPVRNAEVEITVTRTSITEPWFPPGRWDWLYGRGAWWTGTNASWHPTWRDWGCVPPSPPWWGGNQRWTPDELILKKKIAISEEGTARIEIDTSSAKQLHGDMDARYSIEARVVDASRREERGAGSVIAARTPFKVAVWSDHGHVKSGEPTVLHIAAATITGEAVARASGTLTLYRLQLEKDEQMTETKIKSWPITTDSEGRAVQKFAAPSNGQYRVSAKLTSGKLPTVEGGRIMNVHGKEPGGTEEWKFGPLELVPNQMEYRPGDTVRLRVNSDRANAHVWLFPHTANPLRNEAKRVQLHGKSLEIGIPVTMDEMPNLWIEGITIHDAKIHTAVRQILIPPTSKLIEITLEPSKTKVKPGELSSLAITLKDADGKPVHGSTALTIYDKALEAITGGSNVPSLRDSFWNWKNPYHAQPLQSSLPNPTGNLIRQGTEDMQTLGLFGGPFDRIPAPYASDPLDLGVGLSLQSFHSKSSVRVASAAPVNLALTQESAALAMADSREVGASPPAPVLVRKDFADLLLWSGTVQTDADGRAEIPLEFPDNLTTWVARVWHVGTGTVVGEGHAEIIASKDLMLRLQAPRFLVERDLATLSAIIHNDHETALTTTVSLSLEGGLQAQNAKPQTIQIPAHSESRINWQVRATKHGEAVIRMTANAGNDGDAVERTIPILIHGMKRQEAWSLVMGPDQSEGILRFEVPAERRPDLSRLTIRYSPSVAASIVDAIPYLAEYPHGCTEQTLNRFVPLVIAQKILRELDLNLEEIQTKRNNLNSQQLRNHDTRLQGLSHSGNPVFDSMEMESMASAGIERLMQMQISDGGWGWFSGSGEKSHPHTSAVVMHGLLMAKANGAKIPEKMLHSGIAWLQHHEQAQLAALKLHSQRESLRKEGKEVKPDGMYYKPNCDALDALIRMVLGEAGLNSSPMLAFLERDQLELPVYAKCLLGLEFHRVNDPARRDEIIRILEQSLIRDAENQTAYLDLPHSNIWWFWYGSEVEANAWFLKLLSAVRPEAPETRGLVKYLVNNRRNGHYWNSTRDTAYAIEAIAAYLKASDEINPDLGLELFIDGKLHRKLTITRTNLFRFDATFRMDGEDLTTGSHTIEFRKSGNGPLYANTYLEIFSLEDRLRSTGLEVKVCRRICKLTEIDEDSKVPDSSGLAVRQNQQLIRRELLEDGASIRSGDRLEVELVLESKNDYEYLLLSDSKAAGCESLEVLSGPVQGVSGLSSYMEPRDQTIDFYLHQLPRGTHTLRYQLRAEAPGTYKALPATISAMYAPELRGNSEDWRIRIE